MKIAAVGLITGWGRGLAALPEDASRAAAGRSVIAIPRPALAGDRFRRVTRECLLGIAAVKELLGVLGTPETELAGSSTALVYVTAAAYAASNRSFVEGGGGTLHFPYTAPSAVPAEVAIEYGLCGAYAIFLGGASATIDALWYAETLLERGQCERALVLAVETFEECADLYARGRWLVDGPLVEAAACALLVPGGPPFTYTAVDPSPLPGDLTSPGGETFACAPLIALAAARSDPTAVTGFWRGRGASLTPVGTAHRRSPPSATTGSLGG